MKHQHNHSCQCDHRQVRFCKHCNTCYCLDCNAEWTPKSTFTWNYQPYLGGSNAGSIWANKHNLNSNTLQDAGSIQLKSTCTHEH